jgi:diguanylate cyclase (GGDEF)-like protein
MATQNDQTGGELNDDPIDSAKRKLYLLATPIGVLVILAVWAIGLIQKRLPFPAIVVLPALASFFLLLVLLLWQQLISQRTFELALYLLVVSYGLMEFIIILESILHRDGSFNPDFIIWLPFVYILGFLTLKARRALVISIVFYVITLALGLAGWAYFRVSGLAFPNTFLLVQVYLAGIFYIAISYLIALVMERYDSERIMADDMSRLAKTDALTQLDNRRVLAQCLKEEVKRAERYKQPLSVLLFDLDKFKRINDYFGHNTGDEVLQEVARQLRENLRTSDPFGRWGGDEFLCLATNTTRDQALELAERLREAVQRCVYEPVGQLSASFGVTAYLPGDTPETLIRRADLGLYKAKASGRNRVIVVEPGITLPIFEGERPSPPRQDEGD